VDVTALYIFAQAAAGHVGAGVKVLSFSSTLTDRVVGFVGVLVAPSTGAQSRRWDGKSPRGESRGQGHQGGLCVARVHKGGSTQLAGISHRSRGTWTERIHAK